MDEYIFYTPEGYCLAPDDSPVENFQVLGMIQGKNPDDALKHLIKNNPWIAEKGYDLNKILYKEVIRR